MSKLMGDSVIRKTRQYGNIDREQTCPDKRIITVHVLNALFSTFRHLIINFLNSNKLVQHHLATCGSWGGGGEIFLGGGGHVGGEGSVCVWRGG